MAKTKTAAAFGLERARRFWAAEQGLTARIDAPVGELVTRTGWVRTFGGVDPYFALHNRQQGFERTHLESALQQRDLWILPAARGCIYFVPREEAAIALRLGWTLAETRQARDLEKAGVSSDELQRVKTGVLQALADGGKTTSQLRKALPDGLVRSLGAPGKKVGLSSPLPPAVRALEGEGHLTRRASEAFGEDYVWELSDETHPFRTQDAPTDPDALAVEVARCFFRQMGLATRTELAEWSGFGKRQAAAAIDALELVPVTIEGFDEPAFIESSKLDALASAAPSNAVRLLGFEDLAWGVKRPMRYYVAPAHHSLRVATGSMLRRAKGLGETAFLVMRGILHDGMLIGLWEHDPDGGVIVWATFDEVSPAVREHIAQEAEGIQALIAALGSGRMSSIDSARSIGERVDFIRSLQ